MESLSQSTIKTEMITTPPILELRDLCKTFWPDVFKPKQVALDSVNVRFPIGQCTGILGHNGAGKTTTLKAIFKLIFPDKGQILFKGKPITKNDFSQFGYMPEVNKLAGNLTVLQATADHLALLRPKMRWRDKKVRIEECLRRVQLWDHRHKRIKQLSKGMARRAAWVLATIHDPQIVILDEPFSGLDPWGRIEMERWINEFKKEGKTLILCTHEIWAIEAICDRICILNKGRIVYPSAEHPENLSLLNSRDQAQKFFLKISGATQTDLEATCQKEKLPKWNSLSQQGFLITLVFDDYVAANAWVSVIGTKGWILVYFEQKADLKTVEMLEFFKVRES